MALSKIPSAGFQDNVKFRNLIINGDMVIDQRNGGATTGLAQGTVGIDRFRSRSDATVTASNVTYEQSTDVPSGQGFVKSMQLDCISAITSLNADARYSIEHRIEGNNFSYLEFGSSNAKTFTFSFWVKSNLTGTFSLTFANDDVTDIQRYMTTYTINSANTWEKKIITITGATNGNWFTNNGVGLSIQFVLVAGSNNLTSPYSWSATTNAYHADNSQINFVSSTSNYIRLTGLQLEAGQTASEFEFLPHDIQEQRCHRYFQTIDDRGGSGVFQNANNAVLTCSLTTELRAGASFSAPSSLTNAIDQWGTSSRTPTSIIQYNTNKKNIVMVATGMSGATTGHPAVLIKSGFKLDAEL